jgi:hypothetical protein
MWDKYFTGQTDMRDVPSDRTLAGSGFAAGPLNAKEAPKAGTGFSNMAKVVCPRKGKARA